MKNKNIMKKIGCMILVLFSLTPQNKTNGGYADFEFFRFD